MEVNGIASRTHVIKINDAETCFIVVPPQSNA
jgi:hypothetical protein